MSWFQNYPGFSKAKPATTSKLWRDLGWIPVKCARQATLPGKEGCGQSQQQAVQGHCGHVRGLPYEGWHAVGRPRGHRAAVQAFQQAQRLCQVKATSRYSENGWAQIFKFSFKVSQSKSTFLYSPLCQPRWLSQTSTGQKGRWVIYMFIEFVVVYEIQGI